MPSFKQRSYKKELLDGEAIPFEDIKQNMQELDLINHRLGGHAITLQGVASCLKDLGRESCVHIVEIGCGGGDNLRAIKHWLQKKNRNIRLTGIDINQECISYAKSVTENAGIGFICSDYATAQFDQPPHIIFSSLFCHHFTEEELVFMLHWMNRNSSLGFFINDLHRHPLAYYSIKILTQAFSKSYLVKNDAPLSVQRAFIKEDWEKLFRAAGINHFTCQWKWAFRWLVTCTKT